MEDKEKLYNDIMKIIRDMGTRMIEHHVIPLPMTYYEQKVRDALKNLPVN